MTIAAEKYPHLLSYNGRVVPWVTRWSHEQPTEPFSLATVQVDGTPQLAITYPDGKENRESSGILWMREGISRGGEPQYSQVSTYRQRACMVKSLCQVCGNDLPDGPIDWLFAPGQLEFLDTGEALTMNPPTCPNCMQIAKEICPHLSKSGWVVARVLEYKVWGISGETVVVESDGRPRRKNHQMVSYDKTYPGLSPYAVLAKQQVVELTKYSLLPAA